MTKRKKQKRVSVEALAVSAGVTGIDETRTKIGTQLLRQLQQQRAIEIIKDGRIERPIVLIGTSATQQAIALSHLLAYATRERELTLELFLQVLAEHDIALPAVVRSDLAHALTYWLGPVRPASSELSLAR